MKRGEIWTASGGKNYAGKPRHVVILQDDRFDMTESITLCPLTTDPIEAPLFRLLILPTTTNGLRSVSSLMVDKVSTIPKSKIGSRLGHLSAEDIVRLNRALVTFLGVTSP